MEAGDADVVGGFGRDAQLLQQCASLLRQRNVARSGREDPHDTATVTSAQRALHPDQATAGEETKRHSGVRLTMQGPKLGNRWTGDQRTQTRGAEAPKDLHEVLDRLSLAENYLGNPDPTGSVPVDPGEPSHGEFRGDRAAERCRSSAPHEEQDPSRDIARSGGPAVLERMPDFSLSAEQESLRDLARKFARTEMAPHAAECDKIARFPEEIYRKAFDLGLMNLNVPAEYGGSGLGCSTSASSSRSSPTRCGGMTTSVIANCLALEPILLGGTPRAEAAVPHAVLRRSTTSPSFCLTEPSGGSDAGGLRDARPPGRGSLRPRRGEVLHHQRPARLALHRVRDHRPGPAPQGDRGVRGPPLCAGRHAGKGRGQDGPPGLLDEHGPLRERARSRGRPPRRGGRRVLDRHADARPDPDPDRRARHGDRARPPSTTPPRTP